MRMVTQLAFRQDSPFLTGERHSVTGKIDSPRGESNGAQESSCSTNSSDACWCSHHVLFHQGRDVGSRREIRSGLTVVNCVSTFEFLLQREDCDSLHRANLSGCELFSECPV